MRELQTVTGAIDINKLGYVLMHEHLQIGYAGWHLDPLAPKYVRTEVKKRSIDRLAELKSHGVNCIVDPCPIELGRDPELMAEVSIESGVYIVCSTGFDLEDRGNLFAFRNFSSDQILEIYLEEIENGIAGTGIRPGIIKAATGFNAISDYELKCLTAAGRAAVSKGLPIITHTERGTMGPEQLNLFTNVGVHPGKCLIGHCCANHDIRYHISIMEAGGLVGFDRIGNERFGNDLLRFGSLISLIHLGYADRLIISTDSVCAYMGRSPNVMEFKNWHPAYIFTGVIPWLKERGVKQEDIDQMLGLNPKRYFSL